MWGPLQIEGDVPEMSGGFSVVLFYRCVTSNIKHEVLRQQFTPSRVLWVSGLCKGSG